jgi:hypothetical protein
MIKTMKAKFKGKNARTGAPIYPGDEIQYCTATRRAWITGEPGEITFFGETGPTTFYRNPRGRCIDAPCCGCCTI